jgi:hypothetical protein
VPKWAQWQIQHPIPGIERATNRRSWLLLVWVLYIWLATAAFLVLAGAVLLALYLMDAL